MVLWNVCLFSDWDDTRVKERVGLFPSGGNTKNITQKYTFCFFWKLQWDVELLAELFFRFSALSPNTSVEFLGRMLSVAFFDESI